MEEQVFRPRRSRVDLLLFALLCALIGTWCLLSAGCSQATPTAPSVAGASPQTASLFDRASAPFGGLILAGAADTAHVGSYTTFTVSFSPAVASVFWTFGDGDTSRLFRSTVQHWYPYAGRYHVTLTATAFDGHSESASGDVDVLLAAPGEIPTLPGSIPNPGLMNYSTSVSCTVAGLVASCVVSAIANAAPTTVLRSMWYWNDDLRGELLDGGTASHAYAYGGTYTLTVLSEIDGGSTGAGTLRYSAVTSVRVPQ